MNEEIIGVIKSEQYDPWLNLAFEEYLLDNIHPDEVILFLWQNKNTVVIGRNQNAWRECSTILLEKEDGKLARRLSGGGAVYHDTGNLNYTFITGKNKFNLDKQYRVILNAVQKLSIPAIMTGRNDLVADGRKFSGNAFCHRNNGSYHHGTLLVNVDMDKLSRYLRVSTEKMNAKGVKSVKSRVVNLNEFVPSLNVADISERLIESFEELYGKTLYRKTGFNEFDMDKVMELYEKYSSWNWIYGETPAFDLEINDKFQWGEIQLQFKLKEGIIKKAVAYSDAMDEDFILLLPECFIGKSPGDVEIFEKLRSKFSEDKHKQAVSDIIEMLGNRDL